MQASLAEQLIVDNRWQCFLQGYWPLQRAHQLGKWRAGKVRAPVGQLGKACCVNTQDTGVRKLQVERWQDAIQAEAVHAVLDTWQQAEMVLQGRRLAIIIWQAERTLLQAQVGPAEI